jgi:hypothetical protein
MEKTPQSLESPRLMGGPRKLSALLAAALCAAALAACGSSDDSTTSGATEGTAGSGQTAGVEGGGGATGSGGKEGAQAGGGKSGTASGGSSGKSGGGSSGGSGSGSGSNGGSGGGSGSLGASKNFHFVGKPTKHHHPAPVEGKRSEVFVVKGGDNSIQEYGTEQDSGERSAAMQPIAALYKALATSSWTEVCNTYLSASNVEQITLLAEKSPQLNGQGCPEVLAGLTQTRPNETPPDTPDGGLISFRTEGDTGFAIYWGIDGKGYAYALKSEGGAWKLTSLAPTPLSP